MPIPPASGDRDETLIDTPVIDELTDSFLEYSYSVITSRALPDVRDGLKPVHRRLLWTMWDEGVTPDSGYRKAARVVGSTLGKYHPHGDASVYLALVRMAQTWSLNVPVADGHGNFGSLGGEDPPAAMRYTEIKLDKAALSLVSELGEDTVDFVDNYDGREKEPSVLAAGFPVLLVNGSEGIAVGMRTNIPPHNLGETIRASKIVLSHQLAGTRATLDEVMDVMPGPDLPTGGVIIGTDGIKSLYATGQGRFLMRATAKTEQLSPRRQGIVITELPYAVGPEAVLDKMKQLLKDKKLDGVSLPDTKNLTGAKYGLRLEIGVKTGFDPRVVLEHLYANTPLETSFSAQSVALVAGQPLQLTLVEMLEHYVNHRLDVVRRRTEYRKRKAEARLHIVDGLLTALGNIDTVVKIIRTSDDTAEAKAALIAKLALSDIQASHILEMPLRRLTSMETGKLAAEKAELEATITALLDLLGSSVKLAGVVTTEWDAFSAKHAVPRRSKILSADKVPTINSVAVEIPDEPCTVVLSTSGLIGRDTAAFDKKHGSHDLVFQRLTTTTRSTVYAFTSAGRVLPVAVAAIPVVEGRGRGGAVREFFTTEKGERIVGLSTLDEGFAGVALATSAGMVKRLLPADVGVGARGGVKPGVQVIKFRDDDDALVGVVDVPGAADGTTDAELVLVSAQAQLLRFRADAVRPQGRTGGGVSGIKFKDGDGHAQVIAVAVAAAGSDADMDLVTRTDSGLVKVTALSEYPAKGRAGQGVRCHKLLAQDTHLAGATLVAGVPAAMFEGAPEPLEDHRGKRDGAGTDLGGEPEAVGALR
jgi:DNA gyrase subunit A